VATTRLSRAVIFVVFALAVSAGPLAADGPAKPEPIVTAAIEPSPTQAGTCLVTVEVKDPDSAEVFVFSRLAVTAGKEAATFSSKPPRKVEVAVKTGPKCDAGTYAVTVFSEATVTHAKSGTLTARGKR
jgi:hypothetical protein